MIVVDDHGEEELELPLNDLIEGSFGDTFFVLATEVVEALIQDLIHLLNLQEPIATFKEELVESSVEVLYLSLVYLVISPLNWLL